MKSFRHTGAIQARLEMVVKMTQVVESALDEHRLTSDHIDSTPSQGRSHVFKTGRVQSHTNLVLRIFVSCHAHFSLDFARKYDN